MKKGPTQHQHLGCKTQTGSATANGAAALPLRRGRAFGAGFLPRAAGFALLLGFALEAGPVNAGQKPQYVFSEIPLPSDASDLASYAYGINASGLVSGFYVDDLAGDLVSFLYQRAVETLAIQGPGAAPETLLGGANSRGEVAGNYGQPTEEYAVVYDVHHQTWTTLPAVQDMPLNFGNGINDAGHVVGVSAAGNVVTGVLTDTPLNWVWDGDRYNLFTVYGADTWAFTSGINNQDQLAGYYYDTANVLHGFLKDGPTVTTIDGPAATSTLAFGINNNGSVVGEYVSADGTTHGMIWSDGNVQTVDVTLPGAVGTVWNAITDSGDLAGYYLDAAGFPHAVIAERQH